MRWNRSDRPAGGLPGHPARRRPWHLPYVTSQSHRRRRGGGSGIGPTRITTVLGILKAYTTRWARGRSPPSCSARTGEYLAKTGGEVGVTTGRRRRCGWFDAVIARYATRVNGITDYFLTKLDVLSSLQTVPVCVGYTVDSKRTNEMPMTQRDIAQAEPVYEELPGWWEDISRGAGVRRPARQGPRLRAAWRNSPGRRSRASGWARAGNRPSCAVTCWRPGERTRRARRSGSGRPGSRTMTGTAGFRAGAGRRTAGVRAVRAAMRRAQDLAVSAEMPDWNAAADRVEDLVGFLEPHRGRAGWARPAECRPCREPAAC